MQQNGSPAISKIFGAPCLAVLLATVLGGTVLGGGDLSAQDPIITISGGTVAPNETLDVTVTLENFLGATFGYSFAICYDPAVVEVVDLGFGAAGEMIIAQSSTEFAEVVETAGGWGINLQFDVFSQITLGNGLFEVGTATLRGLAPGSTTLCTCDTVGTPPIPNVVVNDGASFVPTPVCGTVTVPTGPYFIRGDTNFDGVIDLADPIQFLGSFLPGPIVPLPIPCDESYDANADGVKNIADAIYLLSYLFIDGPPPAAPFPECGGLDGVDCDAGVGGCA